MDDSTVGAFEDFVRTRSTALLRVAFLLTGDARLAEDLLQDVLSRMYVRWRKINGQPEAYARRALTNRVISHWRWRRRRPEAPLPAAFDHAAPEEPAQALTDAALLAALRALPKRQRAAVVLRYVQDLPEREVAELLHCSVGTVKSNASRGLTRLREVLADHTDTDRSPPSGGTAPRPELVVTLNGADS